MRTGWPIFDDEFGGIPSKHAYISMPGKGHHGKTSVAVDLARRLIEFNPEVLVVYHTMDDSYDAIVPKLIASKTGLKVNDITHKGLQLKPGSPERQLYDQGLAWVKEMIEQGRFAFADAKGKPCTVSAFESWLRELRTKFPGHKIVGIGDNFHLYEDFASTEGENRLRRISKSAKRLTTTYDITLLCPMEVPGTILRKGVRPDMKSIKGSTGPQYDANLNIGVYNDFQDFGAHANLYWDDEKDVEIKYSVAGAQQAKATRKPIIELVIDKNKVNGKKGNLYLKFWPEKSYLEECSRQEQIRCSQAADAQPGQGYQQPAGRFGGPALAFVFELPREFSAGALCEARELSPRTQRSFRKTAWIVCLLTANRRAKSAVVYILLAAARRI